MVQQNQGLRNTSASISKLFGDTAHLQVDVQELQTSVSTLTSSVSVETEFKTGNVGIGGDASVDARLCVTGGGSAQIQGTGTLIVGADANQIDTIACVADVADSLDGTYSIFADYQNSAFYVLWISTSGGSATDPYPSGINVAELSCPATSLVVNITTGDSAANVAAAFNAVITGLVNSGTNIVYTRSSPGWATPWADGANAPTGFNLVTVTAGQSQNDLVGTGTDFTTLTTNQGLEVGSQSFSITRVISATRAVVEPKLVPPISVTNAAMFADTNFIQTKTQGDFVNFWVRENGYLAINKDAAPVEALEVYGEFSKLKMVDTKALGAFDVQSSIEFCDSSDNTAATFGFDSFLDPNLYVRNTKTNGDLVLNNGTTQNFVLTYDGNLIFGDSSALVGAGEGVVGIKDADTLPTVDPVNGGVLYVNAGALTYRGSGGTVTVLAPA